MPRRVAVIFTAFALLLGSSCSGPSGDSGWSVSSAIEDLPASVARGGNFITTANLDGALEAVGLTPSDDIEQVTQWVGPLSRGIPLTEGQPAAPFVAFPDEVPGVPAGLFEAVAGFHIGEVSSFAHAAAPPLSLSVFTGLDDYVLPDTLLPVKDGIGTDVEGEDGKSNAEAKGALSQTGQPTRFGTRDALVALSSYTNLLEDWIANDATLADDPAFADVAEALDKQDVVSAVLMLATGGSGGENEPATTFDALGLGWGADSMHVVYRFTEAPDAKALETLWREASLQSGQPMSQYLTVESVRVDDKVATVTLSPVGDTPTGVLMSLLMNREAVFLSP